MDRLERLKLGAERYDYNPETGEFFLKSGYQIHRIGKKVFGGWKEIKCKTHSNWYKRLNLPNTKKRVLAHHLAWYIVYGEAPHMIDHIEHATRRDDSLNRIDNLRVTDHVKNARNRYSTSERTSIFDGVSYVFSRDLWAAQPIKGVNLGRFECEIDAAWEVYNWFME